LKAKKAAKSCFFLVPVLTKTGDEQIRGLLPGLHLVAGDITYQTPGGFECIFSIFNIRFGATEFTTGGYLSACSFVFCNAG